MFIFFFNTSLAGTLNLSDKEREILRKRLKLETEAQGLRNIEIADLTGWSTSKVSKLTSGKQKVTDDDIRIWARTLGYTPEAFLSDDFDKRSFKISDHVRSVAECLSAYLNSDEEDPEHAAIVNVELPLAIIGTLGLKASDYAFRTKEGKTVYDPVMNRGHKEHTYIRIWNRFAKEKDSMTPEIYICIGPHEKEFAFIVYLNRYGADGATKMLRQEFKDALNRDAENVDRFNDFLKENTEWLPKTVREGEISSYCSSTEVLPDDNMMAQILSEIFEDYFEVVWQATGIDLMPDYFRDANETELTPNELYNILAGTATFSRDTANRVRERNHYKCEIDPGHMTFPMETGEQYMEVAPLIPMTHVAPYGKPAMGDANAVCLCPTCRAQMIFGQRDAREDILMALFRKHRDRMKEAGIEITLSELLKANGL